MQRRQLDRRQYFDELAVTCDKYFLPYITRFKEIIPGDSILEIGCGDGGNLLPFAERGCHVTGVDMAECRINDAARFFEEHHKEGTFIASDIFKMKELEHQFDLIFCHDVLEHIHDKLQFLKNVGKYVKNGGMVFMSFPAWQMPFGGHQQICKNRFISHAPFIHLLPKGMYRFLLRTAGETERCVSEMMEIKDTKLPIEMFERLAKQAGATIADRQLYFINPHYETKFGLRPCKLGGAIAAIPYLRNFFTTSCFYMLSYSQH